MMTDYERQVFERALSVYGTDHQRVKLLEEMAELSVELCRLQDGRSNIDRVASEMADVTILLDQLQMSWQCGGLVQQWKLEKTRRLDERVRDEEILRSASAREPMPARPRRKEPQK